MTDDSDPRARDSATHHVSADEEVVEAELVEDEESSAGPDLSGGAESSAADQVERDLDDLTAANPHRAEYLDLPPPTSPAGPRPTSRTTASGSPRRPRRRSPAARPISPSRCCPHSTTSSARWRPARTRPTTAPSSRASGWCVTSSGADCRPRESSR